MEETNGKMAFISYLFLSVITFSINKLNPLIMSQRLADGLKHTGTKKPVWCQQETHFRSKEVKNLNVKGWRRYFIKVVTTKYSCYTNTKIY